MAGDHKAEIRDPKGLLPYASGVTDITIPLVVSSISPTSVNPLGGDILTITGTGFPIDTSDVTVAFDDKSICTIKSVTGT